MHWSYVPTDLQDELADNYVAGQTEDSGLIRKKWHQLVVRARRMVAQTEAELKDME